MDLQWNHLAFVYADLSFDWSALTPCHNLSIYFSVTVLILIDKFSSLFAIVST